MKPWKVLQATTVFSAPPWITLDEQRVELPDGRVIEPYFRVHLRPWVVMVAETESGEVVMERGYRHGYDGVAVMIPGGIMENGEAPLDAAKRELLEETGYEASEWHDLGNYIPNSNYKCGEARVFFARGAKRVAEPDSGDLEETEILLLTWPDLLKAIRVGEMKSLSSVAAVMLAHAFRTGAL